MIHMFSLAAIGGYEPEELKNVFIMQGFSGLTLFSIFLLMALGLAIIFAQMKVINMAHGEFPTLGAYTTVLCSDFVTKFAPGFLPYYLVFAMFPAFLATALVGALVEVPVDPASLQPSTRHSARDLRRQPHHAAGLPSVLRRA